MSLLPERKKSADEIAKLREALGIGGPPPALDSGEAAAEPPVTMALPEPVISVAVDKPPGGKLPPAHLPVPVLETHEPRPVRSLKRSERIPVLPVDDTAPLLPPPSATPLPAPQASPKAVRSLRKSEQLPLSAAPQPPADSKLPQHRHNDHEINEIRRREALAKLGSPPPPPRLAAHLATIVPGYLAAAVAAVYFWFYDVARDEMWVTASCAGLALLIAGFIFVKRPLSRHHAAFISVAALFVIVFGALYYFPQLNYGTQRPTRDRLAWPGGH